MAHQLLIGKGMITLNLKRIFLALTLLPLFAVAADDCALSDPTLTVQAYTVNPQTERVKMYWQKANGEAWGTLHALLADINSQGQWICPYISRHLLSLNPLLARCRRYSRGER